jgi:diguanylate cyclase (GGDEF)-like protein
MNDRDELTGCMNRSAFFSCLAESIKDARKKGSKLALMYVDIDNMKHFNMHNGHSLGDVMLNRFALMVEPLLGDRHLLFRIGGDSFTIILVNTNLEETSRLAQNICDMSRKELSPPQPDTCGDQYCMGPARISASIGVVESDHDMNAEALFQRAEEKMYEAKCAGRDRICM